MLQRRIHNKFTILEEPKEEAKPHFLSTTTKTESLPFLNLGKPKTKSVEISTQDALGTSKGVYNSCGKILDLAWLQVMHLAQTLSTSRFIFG